MMLCHISRREQHSRIRQPVRNFRCQAALQGRVLLAEPDLASSEDWPAGLAGRSLYFPGFLLLQSQPLHQLFQFLGRVVGAWARAVPVWGAVALLGGVVEEII